MSKFCVSVCKNCGFFSSHIKNEQEKIMCVCGTNDWVYTNIKYDAFYKKVEKFRNSPNFIDGMDGSQQFVLREIMQVSDDEFAVYIKRWSDWSTKRYLRDREADQKRVALNAEIREKNTIRCPYCKSADVSKIGVLNRTASVAIFGLGSSKMGKQWHCNNCKSDF